MWYLIIGLLLWVDGHSYQVLPLKWRTALREKMGNTLKAAITAEIIIAVILMVIGYISWSSPIIYTPPSWGHFANIILSTLAIAFFGLGNSKSRLRGKIRHPQQTGLILWCAGHLMVSGKLESIVLWGGLALWSLVMMALINKRDGAWTPKPVETSLKGDIRLAVISIVAAALIMGIHHWLLH